MYGRFFTQVSAQIHELLCTSLHRCRVSCRYDMFRVVSCHDVQLFAGDVFFLLFFAIGCDASIL